MSNRLPTGPGSRGGRWHDHEYRLAYQRAWRNAHPEYRERERIRKAEQRARRNGDPAGTVVNVPIKGSLPTGTGIPCYPRPLPAPAVTCSCDCACREAVVMVCGFCREGMHSSENG